MLKEFHIQNFTAIPDTTISFEYAESKAPPHYQELDYHFFLEPVKKVRLVPILGLFSENETDTASATIFKALKALDGLALNRRDSASVYFPDVSDKPVRLTLSFYAGEDLFTYSLAYDQYKIVAESLTKAKTILYDLEDGQGDLAGLCADCRMDAEAIKALFENYQSAEQRASFLSTLLAAEFSKDSSKDSSLDRLKTFWHKGLFVFDVSEIEAFKGLDFLAGLDDLNACLQDSKGLLADYGLDLALLEAEDKKKTKSSHKDQDAKFVSEDGSLAFEIAKLTLSEEKTLIKILILINYALKHGSVLALHGMDLHLPYLYVFGLIKMFKEKVINDNAAQLFFSFFERDWLNLSIVRASEISFTAQEDEEQPIRFRRLSEFKRKKETIFIEYFNMAFDSFMGKKR